MLTINVKRNSEEAAQIAFDRASRVLRRLFDRNYSVKSPAVRNLGEGVFTLETLPARGGWRVTVNPRIGDDEFVSDLAASEARRVERKAP